MEEVPASSPDAGCDSGREPNGKGEALREDPSPLQTPGGLCGRGKRSGGRSPRANVYTESARKSRRFPRARRANREGHEREQKDREALREGGTGSTGRGRPWAGRQARAGGPGRPGELSARQEARAGSHGTGGLGLPRHGPERGDSEENATWESVCTVDAFEHTRTEAGRGRRAGGAVAGRPGPPGWAGTLEAEGRVARRREYTA